MVNANVNKLIEQKLDEHRTELSGAVRESEKLKKELKGTTKPDLMVANKMLIMKDKALFHKSAIMVLEDLQRDISRDTYDLP